MNRGFILLWAFVVCIAAAAAGCAAQETASAPQISALAFYQYDASIPIDVEQSELKRTDDFVQYHLWYTSAHDQRVSALLTVPTKVEKPPVVFVQHGYGDSKEVDYVQWPTVFLVQQGYAVISIDAQYHGERKKDNRQQALFNSRSPAMRDAFVQTVIDMRRAVDFLAASDDVDADRLGYLGMSMGAMLGAVFCGVEERVDASCLVVGGGGLARFAGANLDAQGETNLKIIDPVHYAGMISPRPLLMINGRKDTLVPPAAGEALFEAARDPKRIEWYDGGHYDPPLDKVQAWVTEFFAGNVKGS
ncbi:MAG: acetylxylan esterase [Armatimonadota bacterium]|nr:MAG: acetylxylan esterase [Armatimonadota bacterium]